MRTALFVVLLAGCSSSTSSTSPASPASPAAQAEPAADQDPLAAQIEQGKQLYVGHCAKCHGDSGQGTSEGPLVVGADAFPQQPREGAKRDVEFKTAADVFGWATANMPPDDPGSLSTEEYLAVFAFGLTANGVQLQGPLDATQAAAIVLHP